MMLKKIKIDPAPILAATPGKLWAITAANIQWVKLPNDWPLLRTLLGKISDINTQITAPWDIAKNAMKPNR